MPAISPAELEAAYTTHDREELGRLLLELAGAVVGEFVTNRALRDKHTPEDLEQELVYHVWLHLDQLRQPERIFSFAYTVMRRRLLSLLKAAASKQHHRRRWTANRFYEMRGKVRQCLENSDAMDATKSL